ncbi:MAG: hypothetical protein RML46_03715 [Anaerolineae bacterium]|nr:hypothetical protein [Anaerolineae bacterium]MDW8067999.1 hypothetical protein [Anaerolineae bacterium]
MEEAVRALGYLSDDKGICRLYRQYLPLVSQVEDPMVLVIMGSAAANLGHFRTARWLWPAFTPTWP